MAVSAESPRLLHVPADPRKMIMWANLNFVCGAINYLLNAIPNMTRQQRSGVFILAAIVGCTETRQVDRELAMPTSSVDQSVVVSNDSVESDDPYDIVYSNITFLNALLEEHFRHDELSQDALRSYYVDYYLAQVNNGGFSQFVYNSGWDEDTIRFVREGLREMGASKHFELFNESASIIDRIGPDGMERFFESDYFGENKERDILNKFDDKFYKLSDDEDLIELNANWLRGLSNLVVITTDEMRAEVERRSAALADQQDRAAEALANEPRFMKLIRALCVEAQHELSRVTAGDPTHKYNGQAILAWHFITDKGHHYMVEADGNAMMFNGDSNEMVVEIEASGKYGTD